VRIIVCCGDDNFDIVNDDGVCDLGPYIEQCGQNSSTLLRLYTNFNFLNTFDAKAKCQKTFDSSICNFICRLFSCYGKPI